MDSVFCSYAKWSGMDAYPTEDLDFLLHPFLGIQMNALLNLDCTRV